MAGLTVEPEPAAAVEPEPEPKGRAVVAETVVFPEPEPEAPIAVVEPESTISDPMKGLAKTHKKQVLLITAGRKIAGATSGNKALLVEVNCETDFVAKDSSFMEFTNSVAEAALDDVSRDKVDYFFVVNFNGSTAEEIRQALERMFT